MTINDKHLEEKAHKSGDQHVAGTPITNAGDNAHQQRQEKLLAAKAYRFTKGDNPFTIDMGNGANVQDKRPMRSEATPAEQAVTALKNLMPAEDNSVQQPQKPQDSNGGRNADAASGAATGERGLETALRPGHEQNKQYDEKDHLWHDKTGKVVEPPDVKAYGLAASLHTEDAMRYAAYELTHSEKAPAQGGERGFDAALRPGHEQNKQYDEKDHLWHDKTGKVVEPPDIKAYGMAGALHTEDALRYTAYEIAHPEKVQSQGSEKGLESAVRPGNQPNKQFDEKDHLWHDKTGKVVEPPNVDAYGVFGANFNTDLLNYNSWKLAHPEPKPVQGGERGMDSMVRPSHEPNKQFDENDGLWHDKTGKVVEPPDVKAYGAFATAQTIDVFKYTAWKLSHPDKSVAAKSELKVSDDSADSSSQWNWQSADS